MKIKSACILILLLFCSLHANASDNDMSFGAGLGAFYAGIGVNAGLQRESDFQYIAAGCTEMGYTSFSGWEAACGVGAGWIRADILSKSGNNHGIGVYLGPVGFKDFLRDPHTIYGAGISYVYLFKGIQSSGWNAGITPAIGRRSGDTTGHVLLQAGYQF